jgi:DNA polymerase-3 subunit beta
MDFICDKAALLSSVRIVSKALGSGTSMPILSGMKFSVKGNQLELATTDLEKAICCSIPIENRKLEAEIEGAELQPEEVVLNGHIVVKITHRLGGDKVEFRTVGEKVEMRCGPSVFDLFTLPLEDYPEIPSLPKEKVCSLAVERFQKWLEQTTFAALSAKETTRLNLTGVDVVLERGKLRLVATNGYRLALVEESVPLEAEGEYLISADSLKDLNNILSQVEGEEVEVYQEGSQIFFVADLVIFMAKLIEEEYPDFDKVIPRENKIGLFMSRKDFLEALQRAEITAAPESGAVVLETAGETLRISSSASDKGEAEESISLLRAAEKIKVSFKAEYLIDALKRMESKEVTFWLGGPESAGLLEPSEAKGFIYVCMPIRMD